MAAPEFSRQTVETLARRSRFQCSNPDCGVHTIAPNAAPDKATSIGEAAHIAGAKPGAARYEQLMSDTTRSSITNGIWLCRNCHVTIDRDPSRYPTDLLMLWRQDHEELVLQQLGTRGEKLRFDLERKNLLFLKDYPSIVQRIAFDKPQAWEWRLAAELVRHLNRPILKRLDDLNNGYYFRQQPKVRDSELMRWIIERAHAMSNIVSALALLLDRLTLSFGKPGEPGNLEEIFDTCVLMSEMFSEAIKHEEITRFTSLPENGEELRALLVDALGENLKRINELPAKLDEVIAMIPTDHGGTKKNPKIVVFNVLFELPENFVNRYEVALDSYVRKLAI
ncbi:hypothetical protein RMR10_005415 [Agrobacterium rosae]|uniref:hypothetical protein n=1 Tax=Agrobacterium rosae TaxID=1972867 RepID=UPI002A0EDAAA|nr:hypothetical protein [Agrobacterium rosae]MDX8316187.1 hypothetical protein [Agrobacterium rosae]